MSEFLRQLKDDGTEESDEDLRERIQRSLAREQQSDADRVLRTCKVQIIGIADEDED